MITGALSFLHWGFLLAPLLFLILWFFVKKIKTGLHLSPAQWFLGIPQSPRQVAGKILRWIIFSLLLITLSIGASAPVREVIPDEDKARNVFLVIDTSLSMREKDFYDGVTADTRMEGVKKVVRSFIRQRAGDRIGIVVFGGRSFLLSPLTKDTNFLEHSIDVLQPGIGGDGTALGDGLAVALQRLEKVENQAKAIMVVTDGASNAGIVQPTVAAKIAENLGVKIHSIGIGDKGQETYDEATLQAIAKTTGGIFKNASDVSALEEVTSEIERLIESLSPNTTSKALIHYSKYFAGASLILLGLYVVVAFKFFKRSGTGQTKEFLFAPFVILLALLCIAIYSPRKGAPIIFNMHSGSYTTAITVDLSASMDATDVTPSRLEKIKRDIKRSLKRLPLTGQKVALIGFAGSAQVLSPPTDDFETAIRLVDSMSTNLISEQGTNIAEALSVASNLLSESAGQIILITDGETDQKEDALFTAKSSTHPIFPLPVGTDQGVNLGSANIPVKVDKELLTELAQASGGQILSTFAINTNKSDAPKSNKLFTVQNEIGWVFLVAALGVIFVFQYGLKKPLFLPLLLITSFFSGVSFSHADDISAYEAMKHYKKEEFEKAWEKLSDPQASSDWQNDSRKGATKFKLQEYQDAQEFYQKSLEYAQSPEQSFESHYNLGNTFLAENLLDEAISQYDQAIAINPESIEAKTNREIALKRKEQQKNNPQDNNNSDKDKDQQDQNQSSKQNEDSKEDESKKEQKNEKQTDQQDKKETQQQEQTPKETQQKQSEQQAKQWLNALPEAPVIIRQEHNQNAPTKGKQWW